ncbi:signal peptide peptidase SppA [Salicibibacter cibarius]|uniref:Signal peptide peptidase SppA n=1 Tax=Salicibibacter cibarius TaxID=2743000 RepID=A0A7T6Z5L6_9BACI|nr:signal peptide peptidase SppA [Salicibibacter cibarius]QQK77320.1 signal peptide peptidase SppA [Salicibibacter cibarius]
MNVKRWVALVVAVAVVGISLMFNLFATIVSADFDQAFEGAGLDDPFREEVMEQGSDGRIAVIELDGVIQDMGQESAFMAAGYNHQQLLDMLDNAMEDPTVDGIVLEVDSPGGGLIESEEIHDKIVEAQETYEKTVYSSMGGMAASGGYYVSAPADYISAHPSTLTGSIGVVLSGGIGGLNFSELLEDLGVEDNTITTGPYKDILSGTREMEEDEEEILQDMADEMLDEFVDVIVEGRDMPEDTVRDLADGRIYTGNQALDNGLIDGLGGLDDTVETMQEDLGLESPQVVRYQPDLGGFGSLFGAGIEQFTDNSNELSELVGLLQQENSPRLMYLYEQ